MRLRSILLIARHELADALRSRRAAAVLFLYVAGAMLTMHAFILALHSMEVSLANAFQVSASNRAGTVTDALWRNEAFRNMIAELVGDKAVANDLLSMPPIALLYGWLAFAFTPILVVLSAAPRIAEEVHSGSVRFALVRVPRLTWCTGKFLGQALETIPALLLSALGAWIVARFRMAGMDGPETMRVMVLFAWKAWIFSLPFLGLALCVSQLARSPHLANGLAVIAWIAVSVLSVIARQKLRHGASYLWEGLSMLLPAGHRLGLWRSDGSHVVTSAVFLVTLAAVLFLLGHVVFRRKDL